MVKEETEASLLQRRAETLVPGDKKAQGDLINLYKYCTRDRARHFSAVPSDKTRGNGHKLK